MVFVWTDGGIPPKLICIARLQADISMRGTSEFAAQVLPTVSKLQVLANMFVFFLFIYLFIYHENCLAVAEMGEGEREAASALTAECPCETQQPANRGAVERLRMGSLAGMWALSTLEKLLVSQLIKFSEMDENFKLHCHHYSSSTRQLFGLSQINPLYSLLPDPLKPRLIFVFHLHLVHSCGLFTLVRPNICTHSSAFQISV